MLQGKSSSVQHMSGLLTAASKLQLLKIVQFFYYNCTNAYNHFNILFSRCF